MYKKIKSHQNVTNGSQILASHFKFIQKPSFINYNSSFIISLIPQTPNRKPISLIGVVSVRKPIAGAKVAVPSIVCNGLRRTPPETLAANAAENPTVVADPARKTSKQ